MKKFVLNGLAIIIIAGSSFAQKGTIKKAEREIIKTEKTDLKNSFKLPDYSQSESFNIKSTDSIELYYIGKSENIYGSRTEQQDCITYDQDADAFMFTHRKDPETYPGAYTLISSISVDEGITWDPVYVNLNIFPSFFKPSGAIYNPDNSTNIEDCIGVFSGYSDYGVNNFAIMKLDGSGEGFFIEQPGLYDGIYMNGICTTYDDMFHALGYATEDWQLYYILIANGTINAELLTFTIDESLIDLVQYLGTSGGGNLLTGTNLRMAWNNDGSVGYVFLAGVLEELVGEASYQPVVFKSEDQGYSWELIEIESLVNHPAFEDYLEPNLQGDRIPAFVGTMDGVVDMNGNLQLFSEVESFFSLYSGDSIIYFDPLLPSHLFNLTINETGVEEFIWCDSISANKVPDDSPGSYGFDMWSGVGWTNRLQASRSVDGSAVFAIWTDTEEPEQYNEENVYPDIYGWGKNLYYNIIDGPIDFTSEGFNYFTYVSPVANTLLSESSIDYTLGVSKTPTPIEFLTNYVSDPVTHVFVKGIEFSELVITGQEKNIIEKDLITVSQNQPNPFGNFSIIEVVLTQKSDLRLEVFDIIGQKVYENNNGISEAGKHIFYLEASDYNSGVYFYTVKSGTQKVTKKMIVE